MIDGKQSCAGIAAISMGALTMRVTYLGLGAVLVGMIAVPVSRAAIPLVQAIETSINIDAAYMHTQYHENLHPTGDDENGFSPGFGVSIGSLLPIRPGYSPDLYTYLGYDFSAGDIHYDGHYILSGLPVAATDNAVFNRIEARIGLGYPLADGVEIIPFVAGGYQAWNRNINNRGVIGTDEFYHSGLFGAGVKLDVPVSPTVVVSATGEIMGLAGGGITANGTDFGRGFGVTPLERFELSAADQITPRWHVTGSAYVERFNYSGTHPEYFPGYYVYEPLSTTTQFGFTVGVGYSFD
jgi:hypothetical protein